MMYATEEEKEFLNIIPILNHGKFTSDIAKSVYSSTLLQMKMNYDRKTKTTFIIIPFVGKVMIRHINDIKKLGDDGEMKLEADVECFFAPSPDIKRGIGDLVDGNRTISEKEIIKDIDNNLRKITREK